MTALSAHDTDFILDYLRRQVDSDCVITDTEILRKRSFNPLASDDDSGMALALVEARSIADIQGTLKTARTFHLPVVTQTRFTSTVAGADGIRGGLLLSTEKMDKILEINRDDSLAVVQPGVINGELDAAAHEVGMFYAPDSGSKNISGIGGNVATNAAGMHTVKYGATKDNVLGLTVVLADGRVVKLGGRTLKQAYGYNLTQLFVGSEGTLGVIAEIIVKLLPLPLGTPLMGVALFASMKDLASAVAAIRICGVYPTMLEALDDNTLRALDDYTGSRYSTGNSAMLIFKLDMSTAESEKALTALLRDYQATSVEISADPARHTELMKLRFAMLPAIFHGRNHIMEDMAVPLSRLAELIDYITSLGKDLGVTIYTAGHAGDGNVHPTLVWPKEQHDAPREVVQAIQLMFRKTLELGGTISGEHGVGTLKNQWNNEELGATVDELQHQIKALLDPMNILNPGRKID